MVIREITARTVLSRSGIPGADYCLNPYVGCAHACRYCYATFMKRFTGHAERWGGFVDVKRNAPEVLARQLARAPRGEVMISSVTDAYQPAEAEWRLTRRCLELLLAARFPVSILTKSPLVLRDLDLLRDFEDLEVGLTVTTDSERMRKIFEPGAPPVEARLRALADLAAAGIATYVFVGPMLPMDPEALAARVAPHVEHVLIDSMNYAHKTRSVFAALGMERWLEADFAEGIVERLRAALGGLAVTVC